jgi:hypothetical protein
MDAAASTTQQTNVAFAGFSLYGRYEVNSEISLKNNTKRYKSHKNAKSF